MGDMSASKVKDVAEVPAVYRCSSCGAEVARAAGDKLGGCPRCKGCAWLRARVLLPGLPPEECLACGALFWTKTELQKHKCKPALVQARTIGLSSLTGENAGVGSNRLESYRRPAPAEVLDEG